MTGGLLLLGAGILDAVVGDPPRRTHPVVVIGGAIQALERWLWCPGTAPRQRRHGGLLVLVVVSGTAVGAWGLLRAVEQASPQFAMLLSLWWMSTTLAARELGRAAAAVQNALAADDLAGARQAVGRIVGRDTDRLDGQGVVRAAVETVAENTADGVICPLFYGTLGALVPPPGLPAWAGPAVYALTYKAVNTLDSMLGHKSDRYRHFGWAAARLDDAVNWLPARVTALVIVLAAPLAGGSQARAWSTLLRDGRKHPSPNSGLAEAAYAGALDVTLGGSNTYGGRPSNRPQIGSGTRPLEASRIGEAVRLMWAATLLALAVAAAIADWRWL